MTRLQWDSPGSRVYELGVDRGVLYLDEQAGVPWNGLTSVKESSDGGEVKDYYLEGIKYANRISSEEFEATIEAYTYPEQFAQCDGTLSIIKGLSVTRQRRKSFGLSYRTSLGNDIEGAAHGYKIHLVYNALASPTQRSYETISDSVDPMNFSWDLTTRPPAISGYRPTAHFVIDSRKTPAFILNALEDILYGSDDEEPRLPSVTELIFRFHFDGSVYDAGSPTEPAYIKVDAGSPSQINTDTIDGGAP